MPDPGWYDDPEDGTQLRWWSGKNWTDRRMPRAEAGPPPAPSPGVGPGVGMSSTAGRSGPSSEGTSRPSAPRDPWAGTPSSGSGSTWGTGASTGAGGAGSSGGWGGTASRGTGSNVTASQGPWPAPPRTFVEAIKVCLTKYVDGKGRASRSEYWYFALFTFIINIVTATLGSIFLLLPAITVTVRRLHDIGKSAWALLWILVPIVGPFVLIYYSVKPGEPRMNQYG
jgi:uncharacterized membrane protein YhaH (DUF805 family)